MKTLLTLCLLIFLTASPLLRAGEKVTLSKSAAFELHTALTKLQAGLTPDNTLAAADDINALEGSAKSFRQGYAKLLQLQYVAESAKTNDATAIFRDADAKFTEASEKTTIFDLTLITITKEEIKAANITASDLATIKRLLKADTKPETPK